MGLQHAILAKRGIRADRIWTSRAAYRSPLRLIPLALDTYALMRSQYWPRERLDALQDERLTDLFRDARRVPYWRATIAAAGEGGPGPRAALARIPISGKTELAADADHIIDPALLPMSDRDHTSGSTGKPFHFLHDRHASLRSFAVTERVFRTAAGRRYPIVYVRARERYGFTSYRHLWFFARSFNSIRRRMDDFAKLGRTFPRGFILYGYTSWITELARQMAARGLRLPIRTVVVAGEHLAAHDRESIERATGAAVSELYASREVGFLGFECERHRMHIAEEWALVEIVDAAGTPVPPGADGRIIVTTFDNRVMPFIRFDLGDRGAISHEPCPCGRTLRTLTFKGRTSELIRLGEGRVVPLLDIAYAIGSYRDSIRQYQIVQRGPLSFTFRVVPGPAFDAHKDAIERLMVRFLHPRVALAWEVVEMIPESASGKASYFVRESGVEGGIDASR